LPVEEVAHDQTEGRDPAARGPVDLPRHVDESPYATAALHLLDLYRHPPPDPLDASRHGHPRGRSCVDSARAAVYRSRPCPGSGCLRLVHGSARAARSMAATWIWGARATQARNART